MAQRLGDESRSHSEANVGVHTCLLFSLIPISRIWLLFSVATAAPNPDHHLPFLLPPSWPWLPLLPSLSAPHGAQRHVIKM